MPTAIDGPGRLPGVQPGVEQRDRMRRRIDHPDSFCRRRLHGEPDVAVRACGDPLLRLARHAQPRRVLDDRMRRRVDRPDRPGRAAVGEPHVPVRAQRDPRRNAPPVQTRAELADRLRLRVDHPDRRSRTAVREPHVPVRPQRDRERLGAGIQAGREPGDHAVGRDPPDRAGAVGEPEVAVGTGTHLRDVRTRRRELRELPSGVAPATPAHRQEQPSSMRRARTRLNSHLSPPRDGRPPGATDWPRLGGCGRRTVAAR